MSVFIGTSGWAYKTWSKRFYPRGRANDLGYYAEQLDTVEVNATFYRLPTPSAVRGWRAQVPAGFVFAVKGSRAVTHYFRLRPGAKSFDLLLERVRELGPHLGPMLWQLPPDFRRDDERLEAFLMRLPKQLRHAMELRHESWLVPEVFALLREHNVAYVSVSSLTLRRDLTLTADFTYARFHGLEGGARHDYTASELLPWARHFAACARRGIDVYAYFNNDVSAHAPDNAMALRELVARQLKKSAAPSTRAHARATRP